MDKYSDGIEVDPRSRADLRQIANILRSKLELTDHDQFPVMAFFEMVLPLIFDDFTYEIKTREEMGDKHGETYPLKHSISLREDVYHGACAGNGRDLYTIAHEIGHLFLHAGHYSFARRGVTHFPIFKNSEWQADAFAGELLMPYNAIRDMSPDQIVDIYGVTRSAARTQLGAINR